MRLTPDKHLHSREHLLADDVSKMLLEPKRFAAYLGIARRYDEGDLRALAKYVAAKEDLEPLHRGRYFFAALKSLRPRPDWRTLRTSRKSLSRTRRKRLRHAKTSDRPRAK